jgi:hypothetical protein
LLVASQTGKTVGEGVGDAEVHRYSQFLHETFGFMSPLSPL